MRVILIAALIIVTSTPALVTGEPLPADLTGHWAEDAIARLARRNIIDLMPDQPFRPDAAVSRGEFLKWLVMAMGLPPRVVRTSSFSDVATSHPLSPYIEAALAYGVIARVLEFAPLASVRRGDAVAVAVQAMGYSFEALQLATAALPFADADALPEQIRGAIAVALLTEPPLLREPGAVELRPLAAMTRAEAASLIAAVLEAVERGIVLRRRSPLISGVEVVTEKRGVLRALPVWRVQVGAFNDEDHAQRMAATLRGRGMQVFIDFIDGLYKVRVGNFATAAEAALAKEELSGQGYSTWVIQTLRDFEAFPGPFRLAALVVDPRTGVRLISAFGDGQRMRRMRTSELARRAGALAAVNGGFFAANGLPLGCLMVGQTIHREPDPQRTCAGITEDGMVIFDRVQLDATVTAVLPGQIGGSSMRVNGVNRDRRADELILYQPSFDASTRTNQFGAEATVVGGMVTTVVDLRGNSPIPSDGFVLSGHGRARQWILQALQPGALVDVALRVAPLSGDTRWDRVIHAVGGGPRVLAGGQVVGAEGFPATFTERRHPRTAIGVTADGRVVLLVVDGRQPYHSLGMTLLELALELRRLGVVDALNLDGGGSSTMVVGGRVINLPSDETGERPVANALLVLAPPGER